jgi:hypothetical protein
VRCVEAAEGGLNRSSSLKAIANMRSVYNRFLTRFPLLFGYWKKFADLEYSIAGTEAAEMVLPPHPCPPTLCSAFAVSGADDVDIRAWCCECSE